MEISFASRVHACLMGGALGDSFGYLVEFDDLAAIRRKFGVDGLFDLSQATGPVHFSDDTQLTLYTVDGLADALEWAQQGVPADPTACLWLAYLRWLRSQGEKPVLDSAPLPPLRWIDGQQILQHQRHPGQACLASLKTGEMGTLLRPINVEAKGCGSVMRSAPFGLISHLEPSTIAQLSMNAAALTHGHPVAIQASAAFSWLIYQLAVAELALPEAVTSMLDYLRSLPAEPDLLARLETAINLSSLEMLDGDQLCDAIGEGWVAEEALAVAVYAVLSTANETTGATPTAHFLAAMRTAANHRGDSDSTASIAGNILGAFYGQTCLPEGWLQLAEAPELIHEMAEALLRASGIEASGIASDLSAAADFPDGTPYAG